MSDAPEPLRSIVTPMRMDYRYTPGQATTRFLRALAEGRIVGLRCPRCEKVYVPPRGACPRCGVPTREEVAVSDRGTVVTLTVVRVPSTNISIELPYVAAHVLLDGADIAFQGVLGDCPVEEARMGMRVQAVWRPREEWGTTFENIRYFSPTGEPDVPYEQYREFA